MEIVRAGPGHIDELVAMRCELWPDGPAVHKEELSALFGRSTYVAFLALAEQPLGFAEATLREYVDGVPLGSQAAYLEGLFVIPEMRRHGVATALLSSVEKWAIAHGCTDIGSDADADNADGQGWHLARGFDESGRTVNYVRRLAVLQAVNLLDVN